MRQGRTHDYIGEIRTTGSNTVECPECGGRMHYEAEMCRSCRRDYNADARLSYVRGDDARQRESRYSVALEAGWTVAELTELARAEGLPTWGEIAARDMWPVIRSYCRGMTNRKGRQNGT